MKKVTLLFVGILLSTSIMAQQAYLNVKGGVNGVYVLGETDVVSVFTGDEVGYQVGAEFGFKFLGLLGFRSEANYVNSKFTLVNERETGSLPDGTIGSFDITETMNIINKGIQIPTSLTLDLGMLDLNVGPNFEFLLSSLASGTLNADDLQDSIGGALKEFDIDYDFFNDAAGTGAYFDQSLKDGDFFNSFNIGLNLGFGLDFKGVRVDLKTNYTLTDAVNDYYQFDQGKGVDRPISFQLSAVFKVVDFKLFGKKDKEDDKEGEVKVKDFFGTMNP